MNNEKSIVEALVKSGKWSESAARRGYKSGFKCAYCDKDLLASVDDYKEWQVDHIVPLSANGPDEERNKVVSCRTCNVDIKNRWNPATVCKENAKREELIEAVREYVVKKRTEILEELTKFRKIVYTDNCENI